MKLSLKVVTPDQVIRKRILKAMADHLNKKLSGIESKIKNKAKNLLHESLNQSSETQSIISGTLRTELGVVDASSELGAIFGAIVDATTVKVNKAAIRGPQISMSVVLTAIPFDLGQIASGGGSYTTKKGEKIDWFRWLTTLGDAVIVRQYEAVSGFPAQSRTGDKIMIKGKGWRVPPEYAGNPADNFVTRATDSILKELGNSIQQIIGASI
jgi:hypothetical protein